MPNSVLTHIKHNMTKHYRINLLTTSRISKMKANVAGMQLPDSSQFTNFEGNNCDKYFRYYSLNDLLP